ncbi:MAG: hypothetical protein J3Q66DRAFT_39279 [Benniella sp.]|nr:MAG: hypothetical protein J3Q66DRAFT_39279 [Benniella sp.]
MLCPRILKSDLDSADDNKDEDGAEVPESQQKMFTSIMTYLYSGNFPRNAGAVKLINRLVTLGILSRKGPGALRERTDYPGSDIFRTAGDEIAREFQLHYKNGAVKIYQKLIKKKEKGKIAKDQDISIDLNLPAIKNFVQVNKLNGNGWKTVPVSPILRPFFTFSESDLVPIFWKSELLKRKMNELAGYAYATLGEYQR